MTTHLIRIFSTALTISSASLAACSSDSVNSANPTPTPGMAETPPRARIARPTAPGRPPRSPTCTPSPRCRRQWIRSTATRNPYALTFAPANFTGDGVPNHVQPGDLVVSNFSDNTGTNFRGTTFEALRDGKPVRVLSETNAPTAAGGTVSSSGPVALAFAPNGNLWIANFGAKGDGTDGNVQIVTPGGKIAKTFTDPLVAGGWGQEFNHGAGGHAAFFTVNIVTGAVVRINIIVADAGPPASPSTHSPATSGIRRRARAGHRSARVGSSTTRRPTRSTSPTGAPTRSSRSPTPRSRPRCRVASTCSKEPHFTSRR